MCGDLRVRFSLVCVCIKRAYHKMVNFPSFSFDECQYCSLDKYFFAVVQICFWYFISLQLVYVASNSFLFRTKRFTFLSFLWLLFYTTNIGGVSFKYEAHIVQPKNVACIKCSVFFSSKFLPCFTTVNENVVIILLMWFFVVVV